MGEENHICKRCNQLKKNKIFSDCFTNYLNAFALVLISIILIIFIFYTMSFVNKNIEFNQTPLKSENFIFTKSDSLKFEIVLNEKLKVFKEEILSNEKQRNENLKYYGSLVGFILSIVGFFGFKSIHDTKQAAIEKAVFDAKKEATDVAKKEATNVAKEVANVEAKKEAKEVSKIEIDKYLTDEHSALFNKLEGPIRSHYDPIILEYSSRIDNLERPGIYNKEINDFNDKITAIYTQMNDRINKLEKELIEKEIELLKLKFGK